MATGCGGGDVLAVPWAQGRRAGDDPRLAWRTQAASAAHRRNRLWQWDAQAGAVDLPHRYPGRTRLFQEWVHSPVCAASIGWLTSAGKGSAEWAAHREVSGG